MEGAAVQQIGGQQQQQHGSTPLEPLEIKREWGQDVAKDAPSMLRVSVFNGKLIIAWGGHIEEVDLPEDAYTNTIKAEYDQGKLCVCIARKDPHSPAMESKKALDPDFPHPRPVDVCYKDKHTTRPADFVGHGQPTPVQHALRSASVEDEIVSTRHGVLMPEVGFASTVASDMPALVHEGGVLEAPCSGETIIRDPTSVNTYLQSPAEEQVTGGMERLVMHDKGQHPAADNTMTSRVLSVPGTQVVQGARERVIEAQYGSPGNSYVAAARHSLGLDIVDPTETAAEMEGSRVGGGADVTSHALAPAGVTAERGEDEYDYCDEYEDELEEYEESNEEVEAEGQDYKDAHGVLHHRVDHDKHKVGLDTEPLLAGDLYPRADDDRTEPISTVKQQVKAGGHGCDICECSPCQCDKMSRGQYKAPLEMIPAELKRTGRPAMHHRVKKGATGRKSHPAKDERMHARPRNENKVSEDGRMSGWTHGDEPLHKGPKTHVSAMEEAVRHKGSSLRRDEKVAEHGTETAARDDEGEAPGVVRMGHGSVYTGGRVIGSGAGLHLASGRHEKPHALG